jgi:toxin ParE1/3/4
MTVRPWTVRLTATAEADFEHSIQWTIERFSDGQAIVYVDTLSLALAALTEGPTIAGVKSRDEILKGILSLHVGRQGRRGRHFIMFRHDPTRVIEVLRILHDSMDLSRHVEDPDE